MSTFLSSWKLVIRRSLANRRLLSTVIVGAVVAVALLSSTPLYSNVINDLGLSHTLNQRLIEVLDVHIYSPSDFISFEEYNNTDVIIRQQVSRNIKSIVRQEERWIKTQNYDAGWPGRPLPPPGERPRGHFHVFTNVEKHITIVDGEYAMPIPAEISPKELFDPDFAIEGMIGSKTAERFGVGVGDRLFFLTGYGEEEIRINIELTAIIDPIDPEEEYWFLNTDIFTVPIDEGQVAPIFIPESTFFNAVGRIFPASRSSNNWFYFIDIDKIDSQNAGSIYNGIMRMERQLVTTLPRTGLFTLLDTVIFEYQGKLMYTQIPLFLIVAQIVAIVLYYLITVANMLIERQSGEIALFRSRGASTWQIIGIYFMEGLIISAIGAAVGPFLGAFVFSLLGKTAPFLPLTDGGLLPIRFSGMVFILAITAAVLCLLAFLVPVVQAARRGVVHQRQQVARPPRAPIWQRFYLDLVLLAFGAVLYWELKERGSLMTMDVFGGLGMDPLLLITPILLLLAVAIVFLRLFPIIIGLATRLGRYFRNAPVILGLWYMARNPIHYGRLILLLIMATSVGMFSATFLGTLERSYDERVMYTTGSDVRIEELRDWRTSKDTFYERYSSIPGIEGVGMAYRGDGRIGTMFEETPFTLLAVDSENFGQIAWYRYDFSEKSLPELMNILTEDVPKKQGLNLPDGSEAIGIWVYQEEGSRESSIFVRVKDGRGNYIDRELGTANSTSWQYLETDLKTLGIDTPLPPPLTLNCIYAKPIQIGGFRFGGGPNGVYFDDLQVRGSFSSEAVVIEDFEDVSEWSVSVEQSSESSFGAPFTDTFKTSSSVVYNGAASAHFSFFRRTDSTERGIYPNLDVRPMNVLVSRSLLERAKVSVGDIVKIRLPGQYLHVSIKDVVDYFPTLDPDDKAFIIANLDRLISARNILLTTPFYPNEAWLSIISDSEQREIMLDTLDSYDYGGKELHDKEAMIDKLRKDPLAGAGWGGMLIIAFLGVILVSSLGFVVYSYLSAQRRQLDFAILRTLGFSLRQIIGLVCFEQLFIIIAGLGLGTLIGERLSYIMMPFLQLTEKGEIVLPPFILTIDWTTIGIAYIILAVAFIITISLVILFFSRVAISQTLRIGDM